MSTVTSKPLATPEKGCRLSSGKFRFPSMSAHFLRLTLGFTLVELLIVIAIIGALAAIAIPNYYQHIKKAKITKVIAEMRLLEKEILIYAVEHDVFPDTLADIGRDGFLDPWGYPYQYMNIADYQKKEGQMVKGEKVKKKDAGYDPADKSRRSGFEKPINSDFDLYSMGPDGASKTKLDQKESYDDIVRASNGAFIGPAWAY